MSGPYCETCTYWIECCFQQDINPKNKEGECHDPSKIIYGYCSGPVNSAPVVYGGSSCDNHKLNGAFLP